MKTPTGETNVIANLEQTVECKPNRYTIRGYYINPLVRRWNEKMSNRRPVKDEHLLAAALVCFALAGLLAAILVFAFL